MNKKRGPNTDLYGTPELNFLLDISRFKTTVLIDGVTGKVKHETKK